MKYCSQCNTNLPEENFGLRSDRKNTRRSYCKECNRAQKRKWYAKNREDQIKKIAKRKKKIIAENQIRMLKYFAKHSCKCGESHPAALEFDHNNPKEKKMCISELLSCGYGWSTIMKEIKKCTVRCANCHKKKTAIDYGWYSASVV